MKNTTKTPAILGSLELMDEFTTVFGKTIYQVISAKECKTFQKQGARDVFNRKSCKAVRMKNSKQVLKINF